MQRWLPGAQRIYDSSPRPVRRMLANVEAWRRDWFRRFGDYQWQLAQFDPGWYACDRALQEAHQLARLRLVVKAARRDVPHYRASLPEIEISSLADLGRLPILEKADIRRDPRAMVREDLRPAALWVQSTSGSTGTPMRYYHDRELVRAHQAASDALLAWFGCRIGERRARISGVHVAPFAQAEPPFWIWVDHYQQLQCSAYHLSPATYGAYLQALRQARVAYGTGYASAWHLLATALAESGEPAPPLRAIFTDSEGMSIEQQELTERAFGCPVYQNYGLGEVQQVAMQCRCRRYHVLTRKCIVEVLDDHDQPVRPGETGQIVVTDLLSASTPFIRYRTGDLGTLAPDACCCGWRSSALSAVVGRVDDQVRTLEGRWIGRLSHVTKPGVGIRESQIVQRALDEVVIRVVPDRAFEPESMQAVLEHARQYLGPDMRISWERVDALPRMQSGKLRHVVREIQV
jgi:phenylacetate-CoA ligase